MLDVDDTRPRLDLQIELESLRREAERMRSVVGAAAEHCNLIDAVFERTTYGVAVCNERGKLVSTNRVAERLWAGARASGHGTTPERPRESANAYVLFDDTTGRRCSLPEWALARAHEVAARPSGEDDLDDIRKVVIERLDGTCTAVLAGSAPMFEPDGTLAGALCVFAGCAPVHDAMVATHAAHRRALFLVQAGARLLSTSLDPEQTLRQLADLCVPAIADACIIQLVDATGTLRTVGRSWIDPEKEALSRTIRELYPVAPDDATGPFRVIRTGQAELYASVADAHLQTLATTPEHLAMLRALGVKSAITAPLLARQRIVGAITLLVTDLGRRYDAADLDMAEQLAVSAGLAVENAHLYEYEQSARATIERAANRMQRLQSIITDLASTLVADDVAKAVIDHGIAAVGADMGAIYVRDVATGAMRLVRSQSNDGAPTDSAASALDADAPFVTETLRLRSPIFIATREEIERRFPVDARRYRTVSSCVGLPLKEQGEVTGVLAFAFEAARAFDADERAFLSLVADHCAQGLYRARVYRAEQAARSEIALLYGLANEVNRATNIRDVYEASLEVVQRALGVTRSSILLFDNDGVVRFKSWRGLSEEYREAVEGHSPWSRDTKDPTPVFIVDSETDASAAPFRERFRKEGIRAVGFFPLVHYGKLLGKFMVYSETPRVLTDDEVRLAQTIAAEISQAVVRKLSEGEAEAARASAEYASRMKDEFLAVVSHELRTPLASIMGWASILKTKRRNDPEVLAKGLDVIERNARAQATIIEDILDVSRIIRGKLRLDPHPITLVPLIVETIETLKASARAKGIHVELDAIGDQFSLVGDPERLRQIAWNLLSNAIKFTPPNGKVDVAVRRELDSIVLEVRDTGAGIEPDLLPYVFDRFRQADSTTTRRHGGLGLGLSIVRHLVELHGGQVAVKSEGRGKGSTFIARFPVRAVAEEAMSARTNGDVAARSTAALPPGSPDLSGVRVLVVDDQLDAREMLKEALASYGAVVELADSAREALHVLESFEPEVLVTDIGMPDEDGYALLRKVRALPGDISHVPAVAVTAYARDEDVRNAEAAGFQSHVAKPTRPETLAEAVRVCARHAHA